MSFFKFIAILLTFYFLYYLVMAIMEMTKNKRSGTEADKNGQGAVVYAVSGEHIEPLSPNEAMLKPLQFEDEKKN